MPLTVTPLGVRCNLQCGYCYEEPQREAGNFGAAYDLDKIKRAISEGGDKEPFLLFGGEPLLLPKDALEDLWAWGFERSGKNTLQTNGSLIDADHLALFKRYNVGVGISIDGPDALNDARWNSTIEKTRLSTRQTEEAILLLCANGLIPSLIVTLHRLNASTERLDLLMDWFRKLSVLGVRRIGLHLLEVESEAMRERFLLSDEECIDALLKLRALRGELPDVTFSLLDDLDSLLTGKDSRTKCIWQACDPYTTPPVRGIGGQGERTKCSRVNKEGVDFVPSEKQGFERYISLYSTPQEAGGCKGCRFFLSCRGQCPGTAIDGDWRNRSEQCHTWTRTFEAIEKELLDAGAKPISLIPERPHLEQTLVRFWEKGRNLPVESVMRYVQQEQLSGLVSGWPEQTAVDSAPIGEIDDGRAHNPQVFPDRLPFQLKKFARLSWANHDAQAVWEPAFRKIRAAMVRADWVSVAAGFREAALVCMSSRESAALTPLWSAHRLDWEQVDNLDHHSAFLAAVSYTGSEGQSTFVVGRPAALRRFGTAWRAYDYQGVAELLGYPSCCAATLHGLTAHESCRDTTWAMAAKHFSDLTYAREVQVSGLFATNIFFSSVGVKAVPHRPCSFGCAETIRIASYVRQIVINESDQGEDTYQMLEAILAWPAEWSALHGIAEIKSPLLKLCYNTDATAGRYVIKWLGEGFPLQGARGLTFPYRRILPVQPFNILN